MTPRDLLSAFENRTKLPVDVNDVLAELISHGCDDNISFIGVDFNTAILRGCIKIWHERDGVYGETQRMVNIYYDHNSEKSWQRMVCCKELLHLIDPETHCTATADAISQLADEIGLPPASQNPFKECAATNLDRVAEYRAAALLLPFQARNILMPLYQSGKMTIEDIARQADIPRKYASIVMHQAWDEIHDLMA